MSGAEIALMVVGTAVSAAGALQQGKAQAANQRAAAQAGEFNRQAAERNKVIAGHQRQLAVRQAQVDAEDKRRDNRRKLAEIKSKYGASGLRSSGTPLDVLEDAALELETDARRIDHDGQVRGYEGALRILGFQDEATLAAHSRDSALSRAKGAETAGRINAFGQILGGAKEIAGSDYAYENWWT